MQAKQSTGLSRGKTLAAGAAIKQIAAFVLAILAANTNVTLITKTVILALFVGAKALFKLAHQIASGENIF
jgi:hypothetical protein